jgi:hypothetical protein
MGITVIIDFAVITDTMIIMDIKGIAVIKVKNDITKDTFQQALWEENC